ncbi:MAG: TIGR03016 family PEP-CTERM system-associated outer membrane protein, partial [Azoarcus sp.]
MAMVQNPVLKRPDRPAGALRLLVLALGAIGASSAFSQTVTVTPSVQSRLTWTDNVGASSDKESDWIAEISPGITVSRKSGRFSGLLSAQLRNVGYANDSSRNTTYLALQGRGEIEAVENLLFVDLNANISRNNTSAFSGRSSSDELSVDKNNETRTWSIGPRLEFRLGDTASGSVRYKASWLESGGSTIGNQRLNELTAQASDPAAVRLFGWGLSYSRSESEYDNSASRNVTEEIGRATLYVNLTPQFRLRVIGGHEKNDYASTENESGNIYGGGFDWNPTDRTTISGTTEDRVFGTGYNFSLKHRAQRSTWDLSYVKDISSSLQTITDGGRLAEAEATCQAFMGITEVPAGGMLLQIYDACLSSFGVSRLGSQEFVSNAHYVSKTWRVAYSLLGVRNSLTVSAQQSDRSRLSSITGLSTEDDFALSDTIKTTSLTVSLNHKLTGMSSLNTAVTRSRSQGASGTSLDTKRL